MSGAEKPVPVELHHMREKRMVRITWSDGHAGEYTLKYLRGYCPCALCQGHEATKVRYVDVADAGLAEISAVGNYAIQFHWGDGHNTGIYTFNYLRSLCPCSLCKKRRKDGYQGRNL